MDLKRELTDLETELVESKRELTDLGELEDLKRELTDLKKGWRT